MNTFAELKTYNKIVVTGPQRSGTTIIARMIAHDTGHTYIDESLFEVGDFKLFKKTIQDNDTCVIQCPGLAHKAHCLNEYTDTIVLFCIRPVADIIASQNRVK